MTVNTSQAAKNEGRNDSTGLRRRAAPTPLAAPLRPLRGGRIDEQRAREGQTLEFDLAIR
ncbi:MAG TPA: hypothetical protein VK824_06960 [Planctomycetota bacterium]|nr:hypothetical protein [Planctomycetota bacterium]